MNKKIYFHTGEIIQVSDSGGNYPALSRFYDNQIIVSFPKMNTDQIEKIRRGYRTDKPFPVNSDMKIIGYGLHPNAAIIVYILQDVNHPEDFYLYNLDGHSDFVKVVRD